VHKQRENKNFVKLLITVLAGALLIITSLNNSFFAEARPDTVEIDKTIKSTNNITVETNLTTQQITSDVTNKTTTTPDGNILNNSVSNLQVYNLDQLLNISLEKNSMLQSLSYMVDTKKLNLKERLDVASRMEDKDLLNLDLAKVKYYLPYDAEIQLKIAELDKENQTNQISLQVINSYLDTLYLQEGIKVLESAVKRAEEQVAVVKVNYKVGTITKVDVLSAEVQLEKIKTELEQAKNNLSIKKMQLNQLANLPLNTEFAISPIEVKTDLLIGEEGVKKGLEYSLTLKQQNYELKSLEKLLQVIKDYFPESTYTYQSVYSTKLTKEAILAETKSKVELGLRSQQIKIDSNRKTYEVMQEQVKKVAETYNIMLNQYKAGLISYQDLANTDQLLKQTGLDELKTRLDYYRVVYEYNYMLGMK